MALPLLPITGLADRHIGLTSEMAACFSQAAQVCLSFHHTSPTELTLRAEDDEMQVMVEWKPPDERVLRAWANQTDVTEYGAYACALAAVELMSGLIAVSRAETMTGADFYMMPIGKPPEDLKQWIRFEVSGTNLESRNVQSRLREKVKQAIMGKSSLRAMAAVVGFKVRVILFQNVEGEI
jgi:hypothetical protein